MSNSRKERQHQNRKLGLRKNKEEDLDMQDSCGCKDLTPYNAVRTMNGKEVKYK